MYTISPLNFFASRIPREEDRVPPLEVLSRRLVLEPASLVRRRDARLLAHALRPDDDVLEVEVDVRERREELGVEARGALVALPARARAHDLVDAVLRQRRDEARQVAVVLGDRVRLPELADLRVLVDVDGAAEELEDAIGGHRHGSYHPAPGRRATYGTRRRWPGTIVAPFSLFACWSFQTPSRGSPP